VSRRNSALFSQFQGFASVQVGRNTLHRPGSAIVIQPHFDNAWDFGRLAPVEVMVCEATSHEARWSSAAISGVTVRHAGMAGNVDFNTGAYIDNRHSSGNVL
jgi:hypothetical protein